MEGITVFHGNVMGLLQDGARGEGSFPKLHTLTRTLAPNGLERVGFGRFQPGATA